MAGRKSINNQHKTNRKSETDGVLKQRSIFVISTNNDGLMGMMAERKENIPSSSSRMTRSSTAAVYRASELEIGQSSSNENRKRRGCKVGPPAKRPSVEKNGAGSDEEDDIPLPVDVSSSSSSSSSAAATSSRNRGPRLPIMKEEEEFYEAALIDDDSSSEVEYIGDDQDSDEVARSDSFDEDDDAFERDEDDEYEDEEDEYEDEEEDGEEAPLQNEAFEFVKNHMNNATNEIAPPKLMKREKCEGIGSPSKVWSLMVKRDYLARGSKCMLNNHPAMTVQMRGLLIDWMMEVCDSENLFRETFHLAVDYVDRFLENTDQVIGQDTFQLVGTAALFIAAKYEEIYPPKCHEFASLTDNAFNASMIRSMEVMIVQSINWCLGPITSIQWLSTYLQLLGSSTLPKPAGQSIDGMRSIDEEMGHVDEASYFVPELMREDYIHMCKILDYLLFELDSCQFTYRTLAAAVLFACYEPRKAIENATGFGYDQLATVIQYVEPIAAVFESKRDDGEPLPVRDRVKPDEAHLIQSYFKYEDLKPLVEAERMKQKSRLQNQYYRSSNSSSMRKQPLLGPID